MSKSVVVAVSGGVDSSVAAFLLKKAGFEVSGIHFEIAPFPGGPAEQDHTDLEQTCRLLNIPLHYWRIEEEFKDRVIEYFCEEYTRGRTPNPCVRCNKSIKFGLLLDKVMEMGGEYLATGHYARIEQDAVGYRLLRGADTAKDQSYFLYTLGQKELARILFPLGGMHKTEVRHLAAELGFPASTKRESQDICFIPSNDTQAFITRHVPVKPGEIVDTEGKVLGQHKGLAYYTIGQRQGTGVSSGGRLYVLELDVVNNRLIIGPQEKLFRDRLTAYNLNWVSGKEPDGRIEVMARIRYRSPEARATLEVKDGQAEVKFAEPQRAIAPGQSVVFYQGDTVLGGGIIAKTE